MLLLLSKNRNRIALVWQNRVMRFDAEVKKNRDTIYIVRGLVRAYKSNLSNQRIFEEVAE